jgi:hypothetical protein
MLAALCLVVFSVLQAKDPCSQALLSAMDTEDPAVADVRGRIADM